MFIFDPRFANFNQWLMILLICTCGENSLVGLECRLEEAILYHRQEQNGKSKRPESHHPFEEHTPRVLNVVLGPSSYRFYHSSCATAFSTFIVPSTLKLWQPWSMCAWASLRRGSLSERSASKYQPLSTLLIFIIQRNPLYLCGKRNTWTLPGIAHRGKNCRFCSFSSNYSTQVSQ